MRRDFSSLTRKFSHKKPGKVLAMRLLEISVLTTLSYTLISSIYYFRDSFPFCEFLKSVNKKILRKEIHIMLIEIFHFIP